MTIQHHHSSGFSDQKPGTAGLRKQVAVFQQPHYLENFVQAIFDALGGLEGQTLVLGGDGRYYNEQAISIIVRMAAANGCNCMVIGQHGLLSTPAASLLIPAQSAIGGITLTASHNPAGPQGDFGIKFNVANGGQASESLCAKVAERAVNGGEYRICSTPTFCLEKMGTFDYQGMQVVITDPSDHYRASLESLFDFDRIRQLISHKPLRYDAMFGVTGFYAQRLLQDALGVPSQHLLRCERLDDFGGGHPDPNPHHAHELMQLLTGTEDIHFGAASDGDGDRNLIVGRNGFVSPGDSLAILAAQHQHLPQFANGLPGVARSMPTSRAVDAVAADLGLECFETPTGWRFFCNLLDAGRIGLCGEESFGTSANHVREKDGLWAVLSWLQLMASSELSVEQLQTQHWQRYGRHFYQRHDFEGIEKSNAEQVMADFAAQLPTLSHVDGIDVEAADSFTYQDPISGESSANQGLRVSFVDGGRIVMRASGTGTSGATLRTYLEKHVAADQLSKTTLSQEMANMSQRLKTLTGLPTTAKLDAPTFIV